MGTSLLVIIEPRNIGLVQIDFRFTENHPLRHHAPNTWTFLNPDSSSGPQALDLRRLTENRHAIGCQ